MNEEVKMKKHLTSSTTLLACLFMAVLHCMAVVGVFLLAMGEFSIGTIGFYINVPELLCFAPLIFPVIADLSLRLKTDIKPFVTLISPLICVVVCFVFYIFKPNQNDPMYYGENYTLFLLALISFAVRSFYSIIDVIMLKKYKLLAVSILAVLIGAGSVVGGFVFENDINRLFVVPQTGQPDITGSWGSINQNIKRSENWQEYVTDTRFKLGELRPVTEEDGYSYFTNTCDKGTYPHIDGSTVCVPLAVEFARQHLNFTDEAANEFVGFSTTHYAYEKLADPMNNWYETYVHSDLNSYITLGGTDLVLATEPSDSELDMAKTYGVTFIKEPVCHDAFVFITHKNNPVDSLTVEQIQKIYSGEIKNWKYVGGKDEKIRAFQREKNSGSQTAMENLVMSGSNMIDPITITVIEGMGMLVDAVAEYENETASIGYTYRYYIDNLYKNDNIKTISVEGIAPTDENIRNKTYPFSTNYYGVIRQGDEDKAGGQFLKWILSDEGQKCIEQAGYITLK